MAKLLGIDAGTTTVSSVLYEADSGIVLAQSTVPHNAYLNTGALRREQDLDSIFAAVHRSVAKVREGAGGACGVDAVSVTGQMHGFTILDERGEALLPFITWEDQRATAAGPNGRTLLVGFTEASLRVLSADSGIAGAPGYASVNLFALAATGAIPANARWVVSMQEWLLMRLTGSTHPRTDPSFAHSMGLFDLGAAEWHEGLLGALGIDRSMMPPVVEAGTYAGGMVGFAGAVADGTPVYVGMGDNQASFLAAVRNPAEEVLVTVGTGSQVSSAIDGCEYVPGLDTRPFTGNRFLLVGASLAGGRAYATVHAFFREIGKTLFHAEVDDEELYRRMAEVVDLKTKMLCRPTFSGTRANAASLGAFEHVGPEELRPGPFVGSVVRGIAAELAALYRSMGVERKRLVATGNAVRKNEALLRSLGDEFAMTVDLSPFEEEAARGAALIAGVGLGVYAGFDATTRVR